MGGIEAGEVLVVLLRWRWRVVSHWHRARLGKDYPSRLETVSLVSVDAGEDEEHKVIDQGKTPHGKESPEARKSGTARVVLAVARYVAAATIVVLIIPLGAVLYVVNCRTQGQEHRENAE